MMAYLGHWRIATAPAFEPVTLAEAKKHARVFGTEDDEYVTGLAKRARVLVEKRTRRQLMAASWDLFLDGFFPAVGDRVHGPRYAEIRLPRPPLKSVTSIKYIDGGGTLQTLATTEYTVDSHVEPGRVVPAYAKYWPSTRDVVQAVQIRYAAGYSVAADPEATQQAAVPQTLKGAILMLVSHWYEERAPVVTGAITSELMHTLDALVASETVKEAA